MDPTPLFLAPLLLPGLACWALARWIRPREALGQERRRGVRVALALLQWTLALPAALAFVFFSTTLAFAAFGPASGLAFPVLLSLASTALLWFTLSTLLRQGWRARSAMIAALLAASLVLALGLSGV